MIPKGLKELGITKKPISAEILTQEPTPEALQKYLAGKRLGDVPSPAEAFESYSMGNNQGSISRSEAGEQAMTDYGNQRIQQQKNAINSLVNKIYDNSNASAKNINSLYEKVKPIRLTRNSLNDIFEDPVATQAAGKKL